MQKPLPMSFRVNMHNKDNNYLNSMKKLINKYFTTYGSSLGQFYTEDLDLNTTYNFQVSRNQLRNAKNVQVDEQSQQQLNIIHKFIVLMNETGYIQRQEYVSQIPPALLNPQKGYKILDMCAAPGSKTSQLLEKVGINGMVVANDVDLKRTHILMHNVTNNACVPQILITNLDASKYPYLTDKDNNIIEFDAIQADVPCSGDGTLRKNIDVTTSWTLQQALSLNSVQRQILIRAIQLVKDQGYVTYSTCSLNPLEDEAVVASVIREFEQCPELGVKIEICDPKQVLKNVKYEQGMINWPVIFNDEIIENYQNCSESVKRYIKEYMFPDNMQELQNCCRFYPWLTDSGGFFIALLKITKPNNFTEILTNITQENSQRNQITKIMKRSLDYKKFLVGNLKQFCADESRRIQLNPQRQLAEQYCQQIQDKFHFTKLFDNENIQDSLHNLSSRQNQLNKDSFQHVYITSPYVSKVLFSHPNSYELYHIVQAGIEFLHRRNDQYQIETVASYTYDYTTFTYDLNILAILEMIKSDEINFSFYGISELMKKQGYDEQIIKITDDQIQLIHEKVIGQSVHINMSCSEDIRNYIQQNEQLQYIKDIIDDIITIFNQLKISAYIGKNSIGINVNKQNKKCLQCLLLGYKIETIVQRLSNKKINQKMKRQQKHKQQEQIQKQDKQEE